MKTRAFSVRMADGPDDLAAAQRLRYRAFIAGRGAVDRPDGRDADAFDAVCRHVLIERIETGDLAATCRLMPLCSGAEISNSYSAQYYDLDALAAYDRPMVEMGRFCVAPGESDPDILRAAWGAVTQFVDETGVELLFGCSSFEGTDAKNYADAFAMLGEKHIAPKRWLPRIKAPNVFRFAQRVSSCARSQDRAAHYAALVAELSDNGGMGE